MLHKGRLLIPQNASVVKETSGACHQLMPTICIQKPVPKGTQYFKNASQAKVFSPDLMQMRQVPRALQVRAGFEGKIRSKDSETEQEPCDRLSEKLARRNERNKVTLMSALSLRRQEPTLCQVRVSRGHPLLLLLPRVKGRDLP